jgi:hypothetical protein
MMQGRCEKHLFEAAEDRCGKCGSEFCAECLVYSFGPKRPPFCIPCAVSAAGIRRTAGGGTLPRREAKRLERARRSAFKAARRATPTAPATVDAFQEPETTSRPNPVSVPMPAPFGVQ